jgi:hypothetical protein
VEATGYNLALCLDCHDTLWATKRAWQAIRSLFPEKMPWMAIILCVFATAAVVAFILCLVHVVPYWDIY